MQLKNLFAVHGYDGVSNKPLAAKADLTIGALSYFASKEALYDSVKSRIFQRKSVLPNAFIKSDETPEQKLKCLASWFINNLVTGKNFGLLMQRGFISPDPDKSELLITQHFKKAYDIFRALLKVIIAKCQLRYGIHITACLMLWLRQTNTYSARFNQRTQQCR